MSSKKGTTAIGKPLAWGKPLAYAKFILLLLLLLLLFSPELLLEFNNEKKTVFLTSFLGHLRKSFQIVMFGKAKFVLAKPLHIE